MTRLFYYSPNELEKIQCIYLNYVNQTFENCDCGCKGFPINILTLEFNEQEIDREAYLKCPARMERSGSSGYIEFKKDATYKKFLADIYPERYANRPLTQKQKQKQKQQRQYGQTIIWQLREEAKNSGARTFEGSPCINGHTGTRFVKNNSCVECESFRRSMRDAIKRGAFRERLTTTEKLEISEIYSQSRKVSKETGVQHHVDHVKPLAAGGRHHSSNLQILTAEKNLKKGAKYKNKFHKFSNDEKQQFKASKESDKTVGNTKVYKNAGKGIFKKWFG